MEGVIFAVSGFTKKRQNEIREEAEAMGAEYRQMAEYVSYISCFGPELHFI